MGIPSSSGIYQIRHVASGKVYVGSAISLSRRKIEHWRDLRRGDHGNAKLQRAWNKYGEDAFVFEVLEPVLLLEDLLTREQDWILELDVCRKGYNLAPTAGSLLGHKMSMETRQRMSQVKTGVRKSPEHVAKVKEALTGRKMTPEQCQRMREAKLGKKQGPRSEEWKAKISASLQGLKRTAEQRQHMSQVMTGKRHSPETRAKMSASHKARRLTAIQPSS